MPNYIALKYRSEDERPREKFMRHGKQTLSNAELIGILLSTGSASKSAIDLGRDVLALCSNNLTNLSRMNVSELCRIDGIGPAKAITILSALELAVRKNSEEAREMIRVGCSNDAYRIIMPVLADKTYEEFWVILLNRSNKLIREYRISEGSVSGTVADPKKIYKFAIDQGASNIILCHNHPSGNLNLSEADIQLTKKVKAAGLMLDIQVVDHLIVTGGGYYSFADNGMI